MAKRKSKFVGTRMSEAQDEVLTKLQQDSQLSKSEILLRGLELLNEYYSLGLDHPPLNSELKSLEAEAIHHAQALRQIRKKE
jgi:hypothetical protein